MDSRPTTDYVYDRVAMLRDPDREFDRLRRDGDIVWSPVLRRWLVVSRPAALAALRDQRLRVSNLFEMFEKVTARTGVDLTHLDATCRWIPFLYDGPEHEALRSMFARLLSDIKKEYLFHFAEASRSLLDAMSAREEADLAVDYADRVHVETIGRLAGIPADDRERFAAMASSEGSIDFAASIPEMIDAAMRAKIMADRLSELAATTPALQAMLARLRRHLEAARLPDDDMDALRCMMALLLLGRDTLAGTLTIGLAYLFDAHEGQLRAGAWGEPEAIVDAVIRLSSTVQIVGRVATEDLTLSGERITAGESMLVFLPAANHDPAVFECPHAVQGTGPAHIAFGSGRHLCVGMPLARSAVLISLRHLASLHSIRVAADRTVGAGRNTRKLRWFPVKIEGEVRCN